MVDTCIYVCGSFQKYHVAKCFAILVDGIIHQNLHIPDNLQYVNNNVDVSTKKVKACVIGLGFYGIHVAAAVDV